MSGTVGDTATSVSLATLAILQALTSERSLVYLTVGCSTERHAVVFQLSFDKYVQMLLSTPNPARQL